MDIVGRRREVLLLLLTVIVLAILVSLLADVVFSYLFDTNRVLFTIAVIAALLGFSVLGYLTILSRTESTMVSVEFPFCFDREKRHFIDIPHCIPSVHARVHFDHLSQMAREELASYDIDPRKFFGSEFDHFVNDIVQAIILEPLIKNVSWRREDSKSFTFDDLPETMKRNNCLRRQASSDLGLEMYLPTWASLDTFGRYERFIRIKSKYGQIEFTWQIAYASRTSYTDPYIALLDSESEPDFHDFIVTLFMAYDCRYSQMYSRGLDNYMSWVLEMRRRLEQLDWKNTQAELQLVILESIVKEIRCL
jgi:hypothetical protein